MKTRDELLLELVKQVPGLVLTGSRYFGTERHDSDWDFMLQAGDEWQLPEAFFLKSTRGNYSDPCVDAVYESFSHNAHVQVVSDMATKVKVQEILRSTGALLGVEKSQQKAIWTAVVKALLSVEPVKELVVYQPVYAEAFYEALDKFERPHDYDDYDDYEDRTFPRY